MTLFILHAIPHHMDKQAAIAAIEQRAFAARIPIYRLCGKAGIAPSTVTRWKTGSVKPSVTKLGLLEAALDLIEKEKSPC